MNELEMMADRVTNNMLAHATNKLYFDYPEIKDEFHEFVIDYVRPALDNARQDYLYRKTSQQKLQESQDKLNAIVKSLQKWRKERKLTPAQQDKNLLGNAMEEITELARAKTDNERIDAICDICVYTINALGQGFTYDNYTGYDIRNDNELHNFVRVITDGIQYNHHTKIVLMCFGTMRQLGYDPFEAMAQTVKEISSRSGKWDDKLGKFVKDAGIYGDKQSLLEFEKNIKATYPDDNVVFDYYDNTVDVNIDYGKTVLTYKLWYKADYDKCKLKDI